MAEFPRAARMPYRVILGGTPSLDIVREAQCSQGSKRLVLCCSHLYPYKGILEFVRAIGHIRDRFPENTEIRIAGGDRDPVYADAVRREVKAFELGKLVTIAPAEPSELASLYNRAELAIFPSACENAGSFALFDGLHFGLPTVCSDRSSMPEMARGAVEFVNPFQVESFGETILSTLASAKKRALLNSRAEQWSRTAPTWNDRARMLLKFIDQELGATK
jgi:glycosyltransferase involved in cell wall biosynthesis